MAGRGGPGWVGRVGAGKLRGAGSFALETISGELPEELAALADARGGRLWLPFNAEVAEALYEMKGARFDERAARCAQRLRVGLEPAPATLSLIESVGEPRLKLDVNWDPETIPAFLELPAARRTAARSRSTPTCSSRSSTTCARSGRGRRERGRRARAPARGARRGDRRRPPLAGARRPGARGRAALGGELRPFQRAASPTR